MQHPARRDDQGRRNDDPDRGGIGHRDQLPDDALKLASGLKAALDKVNRKK